MSWLTDRLSEPSTHAGLAAISAVAPNVLAAMGVADPVIGLISTLFTVVFGTTAAVKSDK